MVRSLNQASITEKNSGAATSFFLYEVDVSDISTWYLTSNIENVEYDSVTYYTFPIRHRAINQTQEGRLPDVNVVISNISQLAVEGATISDIIRGADLRDRPVVIKEVMNEAILDTVPLIEEQYLIDSYSYDRAKATFKLVSRMSVMEAMVPLRTINRELFSQIPTSRYYL